MEFHGISWNFNNKQHRKTAILPMAMEGNTRRQEMVKGQQSTWRRDSPLVISFWDFKPQKWWCLSLSMGYAQLGTYQQVPPRSYWLGCSSNCHTLVLVVSQVRAKEVDAIFEKDSGFLVAKGMVLSVHTYDTFVCMYVRTCIHGYGIYIDNNTYIDRYIDTSLET